jgi:hypothetical protein
MAFVNRLLSDLYQFLESLQMLINSLMAPISRKAFYERAQKGYCVIVTGETRAWGNFILRKGITVTPDAPSTDSNSHVSHFEWTGVGNLSS